MAHKRLSDARTHWTRALEAYFSPEGFRIEINACIQALRNVTFALQADKSKISNFDKWYGDWQTRMRSDARMKWSIEARNSIVKAKDLELHSKVRATLVGSYVDTETPAIQADYSPKITNRRILAEFKRLNIPTHYFAHAQVKIERRWVVDEFPQTEFLELLAYCWTFLARILADLPSAGVGGAPKEGPGLPPCMIDDGEFRSLWIKASTGELSQLDKTSPRSIRAADIDSAEFERVRQRYGFSASASPERTGNDLRDRAHYFFDMGKKILVADGHHIFLVMLFTADKKLLLLELRPDDQSDKFRMWRKVASEVKRTNAKSIIAISEAWTTTVATGQPVVHAAEAADRGEALHLVAASDDGGGLTLSARFTRTDGKIVIHDTEEHSLESVNVIAPVVAAWKEMAESRKRGG